MRPTTRSGGDDGQAARVLDGGFARLRFPSELEAEFRHHHLLTSTIKPLYLRVYLPAIQIAAPLFGMARC
jgi:hypothetical protein